jgi:hypothetical protein
MGLRPVVGRRANSPAIHRWENVANTWRVPLGTNEINQTRTVHHIQFRDASKTKQILI